MKKSLIWLDFNLFLLGTMGTRNPGFGYRFRHNFHYYLFEFFFRYQNDRMINYDSERGVSVTKDSSGSTLSLTVARTEDSGNYTCTPYNIRPASVLVHVLSRGNSAAAVQNEQDQNDKPVIRSNNNNGPASPPSAAVQSSGAVSLFMGTPAEPSIMRTFVSLIIFIIYCYSW